MKLAFDFSPATVVRYLFLVACGLLAASLAVSFWGLFGHSDDYWFFTHNFDFDEKNNLPHAYKSLLLALCSGAIFLNARAQSLPGGTFVKRWWALGWIFLALAIDEEVQVHQKTVALMLAQFQGVNVDTAPNAKMFWLIPYLIFTAGFCVVYLGFWWKLPPRVRLGFALGGIIYVGGAAIVEELAHHYAKTYGDTNVPYLLLTNVSEWMQMVGSILFLRALFAHLTQRDKLRVELAA
ncbi:MAG: hypothetical protein RLZZ350_2013 [Verrucomicrobiota bacterium]|jgi:H+/Cl- antiporter ClcA